MTSQVKAFPCQLYAGLQTLEPRTDVRPGTHARGARSALLLLLLLLRTRAGGAAWPERGRTYAAGSRRVLANAGVPGSPKDWADHGPDDKRHNGGLPTGCTRHVDRRVKHTRARTTPALRHAAHATPLLVALPRHRAVFLVEVAGLVLV